jgi:hypothetical protein
MIRHRHGDSFFLVTQDEHAKLSGTLAARVGNDLFAMPSPYDDVVRGISMHDSGWPLHDDSPTLDEKGLPLHVFESPAETSTAVWSESVRRASEAGDYCGLLVSLHVLALSSIALSHYMAPDKRLTHARQVFELNKFQQNQIEAQENLRNRLHLRTDLPLQYGLAPRGSSAAEDLLLCNYNLLKAMDRVSLALLCSEPLFETIEGVYPRPGAEPIDLRLRNLGEWTLRIDPWPLDQPILEVQVPYRQVPARAYASVEEFRAIYSQTPTLSQKLIIVDNR